jgi:LysR family glycine cleavage system transcriptional activator
MKALAHLNALRAFEAAARHSSFASAAVELSVTPAAIGQQVRGLEAWLGIPLFARSNTGPARLVPTDAARSALPDIRAGFDRLSVGLERLKDASTHGVLTVTVSPAFAAKWLLPRIERFQSAHENLSVRIDTNLRTVDFLSEGVDIGVRYGAGEWPGLQATLLMKEEIYPVCSPALLKKGGRIKNPADLRNHTLIHDTSMASIRSFPDWRIWLDAAGYQKIESNFGLQINNSAAVIQTAIDGQGIALGRSVMVADDIAAGRLIRPFGKDKYPVTFAYYVVHRSESSEVPRIAAFRTWLLDEVSNQRG